MTTINELKKAAAILDNAASSIPQNIRTILYKHGTRIERAAAILTPEDTGLLKRANRSTVTDDGAGTIILTVDNNKEYAHYQHEHKLNHPKPTARDKFIEIPFNAEIERMSADISDMINREVTP